MEAFLCTGCGARLHDPMGATFVTCTYCGQGVQLAATRPPPPPQNAAQFPVTWQPPPAAPVGYYPAQNPMMTYLYVLVPVGLMMIGGIVSAVTAGASRQSAIAVPTPVATVAPPLAVTPDTPATDPIAAGLVLPSSRATLKPSAPSYATKQSAVIHFENMPSTTHAWISIAKAGTNANGYLTYKYVDTASGAVTFPLATYAPGSYVTRAYADSGYTIISESSFTITPAATARH